MSVDRSYSWGPHLSDTQENGSNQKSLVNLMQYEHLKEHVREMHDGYEFLQRRIFILYTPKLSHGVIPDST